MQIKRKLFHLLRRPYFPIEQMGELSFRHLEEMKERYEIVAGLVMALEGKKVLDIGCGHNPLSKHLQNKDIYVTSVDPILNGWELGPRYELLGEKVEDFEMGNRRYDTVVILGLGHTMGREAFKAINKILALPTTENFILEYSISWFSGIYSGLITKPFGPQGWRRRLKISLRYSKNTWHGKRIVEVWKRC